MKPWLSKTLKSLMPGSILILIVLSLLLIACQTFAAAHQYKGNLLDPPVPQPDFELAAADGSTFRLSQVEGKIALIFFGYTHCPDVCPLTVTKIKNALAGLSETERARVQFIFISVDPERDTPEVLGRYLGNVSPEFIGLTDDFDKIEPVLKTYWAYAEKEPPLEATQVPGHTPTDHTEAGSYLVMHTGRVYLVTPQRDLLLTYPFDVSADDLRSDLSYLLSQ